MPCTSCGGNDPAPLVFKRTSRSEKNGPGTTIVKKPTKHSFGFSFLRNQSKTNPSNSNTITKTTKTKSAQFKMNF